MLPVPFAEPFDEEGEEEEEEEPVGLEEACPDLLLGVAEAEVQEELAPTDAESVGLASEPYPAR
jgi:hypothetical protein